MDKKTFFLKDRKDNYTLTIEGIHQMKKLDEMARNISKTLDIEFSNEHLERLITMNGSKDNLANVNLGLYHLTSLISIPPYEKVLEEEVIKEFTKGLSKEYLELLIDEGYVELDSNDELYDLLDANIDLYILKQFALSPNLQIQLLVGQLIYAIKNNHIDISTQIQVLANENRIANGDTDTVITDGKNALLLWDLMEEFYNLKKEDNQR